MAISILKHENNHVTARFRDKYKKIQTQTFFLPEITPEIKDDEAGRLCLAKFLFSSNLISRLQFSAFLRHQKNPIPKSFFQQIAKLPRKKQQDNPNLSLS